MEDNIMAKVDKTLELSVKYNDIIGNEVENLQSEYQLRDSGTIGKRIAELKEKNRLLRIGVIGKVKAGKSSLLNSVLFEGRDVLPKAATPMTASLAVISHGAAFGARIEYFTREDIQKIGEKATEYKNRLDEMIKLIREENSARQSDKFPALSFENLKPEKDLSKEARRRVNSPVLEAAFDQYERMEKSGLLERFLAGVEDETVSAESEREFLKKLPEYLGSEGKKMPFTRSVKLFFPQDNLKELAIIDTPGLDDPVPSRSERTNEYLSQCDVVLVVSPAGEFLTDEDINLMDRLGRREGLAEIFLLASQADTQLSAQSIVEEYEGNFTRALKHIRKELSSHAREHLENILKEEAGVSEQYGSLAGKQGSQVLLTSAAAYALERHLDNKAQWNATLEKVYELLCKNYPDYFEDRSNARSALRNLAGIEDVWELLKKARSAKDEILARRIDGIMEGVKTKLVGYLNDMQTLIGDKIKILETTDKVKLEEQRKELVRASQNGSVAVDLAFDDSLDMFRNNLKEAIESRNSSMFSETQNKVKNEEFERTKTRHWTTGWWLWKKHHSEDYTVAAIKAGAVRAYINALCTDLGNALETILEKQVTEWKKSVQAMITRALRENVEIDLINLATVKSAIRKQINSLEIPDIDFSNYLFKDSTSGVLEGSEAERYLDKALDHLETIRHKAHEVSREFIRKLDASVRKFKISEQLFADLVSEIRNLEELLETKNASLARLKTCAGEFANVR